MRLLVVMDELERIHPGTDTTLVLIEAARERGHTVDVCQPCSLELDGEDPFATVATVEATDRARVPCVSVGPGTVVPLSGYDVVLVRKDPPFDLEYHYATLILERARGRTLIVNDPRGLRDTNEKLYIFSFPELIARTRVTRSTAVLRRFLDEQGGQMVVKPLDGCGGAGVFHVRADDRNTNAILEMASCDGCKLVMAQAYLPAARQGDKRILLLDGEPLGAVLRVPRPDETRGNLHVGGAPVRTELSTRDLEICAQVGERCRKDGLYFVGIDVIGDFLTEVNVTSPTGVQEIDRLEQRQGDARLEVRVVEWLEKRVATA
jgi:glutathione synthase